MNLIRFLDSDGCARLGVDRGNGTARIAFDLQGVLGPAQDTEAARALLAGRHALVADDDAGMRHTMAAILERFDCRCTCCCDGHEALDRIASEPHDLVVSDIAMPDHDGYDVFAAAKKSDPDLPVVLVTGFGYDPGHAIVRASNEGVEAVLYKPFTPQEFVNAVTEALHPVNGVEGLIQLPLDVIVATKLAPVAPRELFVVDCKSFEMAADGTVTDCKLRVLSGSGVVNSGDVVPGPSDPTSQTMCRPGLGVIIGTDVTAAPVENMIQQHVFGYTACMEIETVPTEGAGCESAGAPCPSHQSRCLVGPVVVTSDDCPDISSLNASIQVDGTPAADVAIGLPHGKLEVILQQLSKRITLTVGTMLVILPEGDSPEFACNPGALVTMHVEGIGSIGCTLGA